MGELREKAVRLIDESFLFDWFLQVRKMDKYVRHCLSIREVQGIGPYAYNDEWIPFKNKLNQTAFRSRFEHTRKGILHEVSTDYFDVSDFALIKISAIGAFDHQYVDLMLHLIDCVLSGDKAPCYLHWALAVNDYAQRYTKTSHSDCWFLKAYLTALISNNSEKVLKYVVLNTVGKYEALVRTSAKDLLDDLSRYRDGNVYSENIVNDVYTNKAGELVLYLTGVKSQWGTLRECKRQLAYSTELPKNWTLEGYVRCFLSIAAFVEGEESLYKVVKIGNAYSDKRSFLKIYDYTDAKDVPPMGDVEVPEMCFRAIAAATNDTPTVRNKYLMQIVWRLLRDECRDGSITAVFNYLYKIGTIEEVAYDFIDNLESLFNLGLPEVGTKIAYLIARHLPGNEEYVSSVGFIINYLIFGKDNNVKDIIDECKKSDKARFVLKVLYAWTSDEKLAEFNDDINCLPIQKTEKFDFKFE